MKSVSGKQLCKIVECKGWMLSRVKGSHYIYEKSGEDKILSIPIHRNQALKAGTQRALMKIAQLSDEDLCYLDDPVFF